MINEWQRAHMAFLYYISLMLLTFTQRQTNTQQAPCMMRRYVVFTIKPKHIYNGDRIAD